MQCKFCQRISKNKRSLTQHEIRCSKNENRIPQSPGMTGKKGGNQFTTSAQTHHYDSTKEKIGRSGLGRKHTDITKKKMSESKKLFLEENPHMVPYVLYHFTKISYPEQYFIECFSDVTVIIHQHRISRFLLDFANVESKRYLEIDGELHYYNEAVIQKDIRRTEFLKSKGWEGIRVRWKDFSILNFDQRKHEVDRIKSFLT